ncbi:MAG: diphosphate--fructose-6-phosphate 1-phosphotransferase [Chloroflexi bacterium]|nr:diphosphate--fructose-6-phosphate 1-phosphotransferase [Chloroflexota bacterium]MDA1270626.1 diphosphate--fructose-6-phosphate 1-phosphotransferase [Chloroflexota bacterium]
MAKIGRMGILVGGGPAPGINSAISAATIEAVNSGLSVVGIIDGFKHLADGRTDMVRPLAISDVSRIHSQGGSVLRTSRTNPARREKDLRRTVESIKQLGIDYLVTIGGDDTAYGASEVARAADGGLKVAHVPKTIDNDLPLPGGQPTFGFETVRQAGTEAVLNLMEEARTTNRWYFVVVMGREAGHLALGITKAAGATLALIPEEFSGDGPRLAEISKILEGAILKRRVMGNNHGVAVIAEGIAEKLAADELENLPGVSVEHDSYGHISLNDIPLAIILRRYVQQAFSQRGEDIAIVDVTLGYQLRGARPIPFDIDYTRTLGYGAVRFLLSDTEDEKLRFGGLICQVDGHRTVLGFDELRDPDTGRIRVRRVDVHSEYYAVAQEYMIRLEQKDLDNRETLEQLARFANMSPEAFAADFAKAAATGNPGPA